MTINLQKGQKRDVGFSGLSWNPKQETDESKHAGNFADILKSLYV